MVLSDGSQEASIEAISEVQTLVLLHWSATSDDAGGAPAGKSSQLELKLSRCSAAPALLALAFV